ncbi:MULTISPECIES: KGK domain-containing protein [unclassified Microcoleus]|uniref:KGK domain-containing protein n=1 Tax=unclassified Microcoleus TaxID=2642155 RepID=UPI001DB3FB6B|nr:MULTISPECIES: KGK domain-containing protein [unclassified Microcoleus]MCC3443924.1 KGK family protein [Microcoleus sp. PH2017_03_ELD_O_A]MCC3501957.1 KGK family protein [Microcoleus sp. PH2017_19_SFW_U_A]MCC3508762.1 KGK family protein [Microcoleus sp. PH2017_17_BER_D_A]TAE75240.1 MAG: KGK family protein [Oscillatoriales cyanobacterium]MCC3409496.1 KGK family protein [Microcoleus sp. PH2017_10_PVI_O_A]
MNAKFQDLECDTDILLIEKDTFTVERFKDLMRQKLAKNLNEIIPNSREVRMFFKLFYDCSIGELDLKVDKGQWIFPPAGMTCQLLKIGSQAWQKGKLRVKAYLKFNFSSVEVQISCDFCPDEPAEPESILDDIRQSEEYKKLANNN